MYPCMEGFVRKDMGSCSLIIFVLFSVFTTSLTHSPLKGLFLNCGGGNFTSGIDGRKWTSDEYYVVSGSPKTLNVPVIHEFLSTVRTFPHAFSDLAHKYCYALPVTRNTTYLIRTSYFYGDINGRRMPPVFYQIVEGTVWTTVNTTEDYAKGFWTYYEGIFLAKRKTLSICLAPNQFTESDPFISAIELIALANSLYNATDFNKSALLTVARHNFGNNTEFLRYPDDAFDRIWAPFNGENAFISRNNNISEPRFWNLLPSKLFDTSLVPDHGSSLKLQWPNKPLPPSNYYIALYFADNDDSFPRKFSISINEIDYYKNLSVSPSGASVFASCWPLDGITNIMLHPSTPDMGGPIINAGEVFQIIPFHGRTATRDIIALENVRKSLDNPPIDWKGDPCLPVDYPWTGLICSEPSDRTRVIGLNLTSLGIWGTLSPSISNLSALTDVWLGNNNFYGTIPDLKPLKKLITLHLENNNFSGEIPPSFAEIETLHELFLQNNQLVGEIPERLKSKSGLNLLTYGNNLAESPAPSPAP